MINHLSAIEGTTQGLQVADISTGYLDIKSLNRPPVHMEQCAHRPTLSKQSANEISAYVTGGTGDYRCLHHRLMLIAAKRSWT
jgi:hypothetical protein